MTVRIVTDSSAVLPRELIERHRIAIVPLTISWSDDESFRNGDLTYAAFEERTRTGAAPKTSAPSPGEYQVVYEQLLDDAGALLVITPPAELSATFTNARLAAQTVDGDRIEVFDSRSAAAGQGLVTLEAARAAEAGAPLAEVRDRAAFVTPKVQLYATLERLDYLRRSGRVPGVAAIATGALDIHPIFRFVDGAPSPAGVVRGAQRAADRLFRAWSESVPEAPARGRVSAMHSSRAQEADTLRERILERVPDAEVAVVEITAAMAAHIGPGMLGLAWWWGPA